VERTVARAGDEAAVVAEWQDQAQKVHKRLTLLEKGLQKYLEASTKGRISREKLRSVAVAVGTERLRLDEQLAEIEEKAAREASAVDQQRELERARLRLVDLWETLPFNEKRSLLRQVLDRLVVRDDEVKVYLRG
jgi:hypothetical protein